MFTWQARLSTSGLKLWQRDLIQRVLLSSHFKDKEEAMKLLLVLLVNYSIPDKAEYRKEVCLAGELPKPKRKETQSRQPDQKPHEEHPASDKKSDEDRKRVASLIRILRADLERYFKSEGRHEMWDIQIERVSKLVRFVRRFVNTVWAPHLPQPDTGWKAHELGIVYPEPLFLRPMGTAEYFVRHRQLNDKTSTQKKRSLAKDHPFIAGLHNCRHYIGAGDARCMLSLTKWFERENVRTTHFGAFTNDTWKHLTGDSLLLIGNNRTNWTVVDIQSKKMQMDVRFSIQDKGIETPQPSVYKDETRPVDLKSRTAYGIFIRRRHPDTKTVLTFILVNEGALNLLLAEYMTDEGKLKELFTEHLRLADDDEMPEEFEILFSGKLDSSDHSIERSATSLGYRLGRGPAFLWNSHKNKYDQIELNPQDQSGQSATKRKAQATKRARSARQKQ